MRRAERPSRRRRPAGGTLAASALAVSVLAAAALAPAALLSSCGAKTMTTKRESLDSAALGRGIAVLSGRKTLFGHQSVGSNILQGIDELREELDAAPLEIIEAAAPIEVAGDGIYHFPVGANGDPGSKIRDFAAALRSGNARSAQIAAMKFCYADVGEATDVPTLFESYRKTMADLRAEFPRLRIVHFTVPLESDDGFAKAALKSLLGRRPRGRADNLAKERYNALLRAEYAGKEPVFDIALYESSSAGGARLRGGSGGGSYPALRPEYSGDGGHLNAAGRRWIAGQLILLLGSLDGGP